MKLFRSILWSFFVVAMLSISGNLAALNDEELAEWREYCVPYAQKGTEGLNKELFRAATVGDTKEVARLIDEGVKVDVINGDGETPLVCASNYGNYDTVVLLLSRGASDGKDAALVRAAHMGHPDIVAFLIKNGADANACEDTEIGRTALVRAAEFDQVETTRCLLENGADVNAYEGLALGTAVHKNNLPCQADRGYVQVARLLLEWGADPYIKDSNGETVFDTAKRKKFCVDLDLDEYVKPLEDDWFEKLHTEVRELERKRLITTGAALQHYDYPRDVIGEVLEKSAEMWGVKRAVEISEKDESSSACPGLPARQATADREE